jgi:putative phage-type endonuclease
MSGIGASESAALFGVSPHHTKHKLWAEKAGLLQHEESDEEYLDWGQFLEEPIAQRYATVTKRKIWQGSPYCVAQHPDLPMMFATPDRWVIEAPDRGSPGLLQVKNAGWYKADEWEDGPPDYVQIQTQHEMAVTGRQWHSVAVLIGGNRWAYWDIERNDAFIAELYEQIQLFWRRVKRKEAPPPEDIDHRSLGILKKLHPAESTCQTTRSDGGRTSRAPARLPRRSSRSPRSTKRNSAL